jgi:hypothetical protein
MDEKTLELRSLYGWEGYGIYWAIIETLRDQDGYAFSLSKLGGLAVLLGKDREWTEKFVSDSIALGLFKSDGEVFYSQSLRDRMHEWDMMRERNSKAAGKSWESRRNADAMQVHSECKADAMPIRLDKIRVEDNKKDREATPPPATKARPLDSIEATAYFLDIGLDVHEAEKFFDHFTANGWVQGRGKPIKDWKAAARNWKRNIGTFGGKNGQPKPILYNKL